MARISNEQIIDIRNRVNIVDVISEYVPLTQKGKNYFGICPFHDDHNPSMSVDPSKQIFKCFVCGVGGNVFSFIMEYEHLSFIESVKKIADKLNIPVDIGPITKKNDSHLSRYYDVYELIFKFYQNNLKTNSGKIALDYLSKRGINDEIIKEFGIGLSTTGNRAYKTLSASGYDDKTIDDSGLCSSNDKGYYDVFNNRIMFPIWNPEGKVVGFSGRIYNTEDSAKYVNSKESPIFKKGQLLYNYHKVKEHVRKEGYVIIVEGQMDVIGLYKAGIKNAIATLGTAMTKDQAHLIKKLSPNVILMFDGDKAGNKATIACSEELVKIGIIPKIVRLEDNLDPDDYISKYGVEKLKDHLSEPLSLLDYKMTVFKADKNMSNSSDVSNYINEVIKELNLVKDNIVREITIQRLSKETGVKEDTLYSLLNKEVSAPKKEQQSIKKEVTIPNKYQLACQNLIFYMLRYKEVIRFFNDSDVFIPVANYRYLACEILTFYKKYGDIVIADFIAYLEDKKELLDVLNKITALDLPEQYHREEIDDYIKTLNDYMIELTKQKLQTEFKNSEDKVAIANKIMELRKGVSEDGRN